LDRGGTLFVSRRIGTMNDVSHPGDYERSDADPRLVAAIALGLAIFLIGTPALLITIYPRAEHPAGIPNDLPQPPAPRLQIDPKADLSRLRADETARLDSYGWIDRDRQLARIPVARAIELTAQRGLPGWPAPTPPASTSR
jgi:hypothetical protein